MSYLKYSFLLGNDPLRLRSPFCSGDPVLPPRPCWAGCHAGGPAHHMSQPWGSREERGQQPVLRPGVPQQPLEPAASSCGLEQLQDVL